MKLKIGILCSGELGLITLKEIRDKIELQFIFTDKNSFEIIEYANSNDTSIFIGNPRKNCPYSFLSNFETDIILSINYLFIVDRIVLDHPKLFAINFHGSLLPKYRGRTPHVWAIINGEKETGITAHLMKDACDTGDIVMQKKVLIEKDDTGASLLNKFKSIYPPIIFDLINQIQKGKLSLVQQDNRFATFFGKRTPEDGQINWNWQKERIYNWVRAQSYPYPGAFTIINNQKIIIDWVEFMDLGFSDNMINGLIIEAKPFILVKTPNGVLKLARIRDMKSNEINANMIFKSPCL